jgi:hypothetical protein
MTTPFRQKRFYSNNNASRSRKQMTYIWSQQYTHISEKKLSGINNNSFNNSVNRLIYHTNRNRYMHFSVWHCKGTFRLACGLNICENRSHLRHPVDGWVIAGVLMYYLQQRLFYISEVSSKNLCDTTCGLHNKLKWLLIEEFCSATSRCVFFSYLMFAHTLLFTHTS